MKPKKVLILCSLVIAFLDASLCSFHATSSAASSTSTGLQMTAMIAKQKVYVAEPIILEVIITNTSNKSIRYQELQPAQAFELREYQLTVKDQHGNPLPLTQYGTYLNSVVAGSINNNSLASHQHIKCKIVVNSLFDMTLPQLYTITVKRTFLEPSPKGYITHDVPAQTVKVLNLGERPAT